MDALSCNSKWECARTLQKQGEIAMKKIIISLLAVLAFSWASGVAADQSPESIVSCSSIFIDGIFTYAVIYSAISSGINAEMCA